MVRDNLLLFSEEVTRLIPYIIRGIFKKQKDVLWKGKITLVQYLALDFIDSKDKLKMKDIAGEFSVSLPAATGLVNRLHRLKLVQRTYGEKDRRVIFVSITSQGKKIVNQIRARRKQVLKEIFGQLKEDERSNYLNVLRKLMRILYKEKHGKQKN